MSPDGAESPIWPKCGGRSRWPIDEPPAAAGYGGPRARRAFLRVGIIPGPGSGSDRLVGLCPRPTIPLQNFESKTVGRRPRPYVAASYAGFVTPSPGRSSISTHERAEPTLPKSWSRPPSPTPKLPGTRLQGASTALYQARSPATGTNPIPGRRNNPIAVRGTG